MDKIIITLPNGEQEEYEVIFTFKSKNTNKDYVVYTNYEKDENNIIKCYSGIYEDGNITKVDTEEEIKTIDKILKDITTMENIDYKREQ